MKGISTSLEIAMAVVLIVLGLYLLDQGSLKQIRE
jgi:sulfite exporter TauE/SafE